MIRKNKTASQIPSPPERIIERTVMRRLGRTSSFPEIMAESGVALALVIGAVTGSDWGILVK